MKTLSEQKFEETQFISDDTKRNKAFKIRRVGLLKKSMQLSLQCRCKIQIKIWNNDDNSLLEYKSESDLNLDNIKKSSDQVI